MNNAGLKTFVCSFSFSLLAFVAAGKEFFVAPSADEQLVIPSKNISLFFKDNSPQTVGKKTVAIKKIALNVPVTPPANDVLNSNFEKADKQTDLIPLTFESEDIEFNLEPPKEDFKIAQNLSNKGEKGNIVATKKQAQKESKHKKIIPNFKEMASFKPDIKLEVKDNSDTKDIQTAETEDFELSPFKNKILQANVQIIRPNDKNIQKILHPQTEDKSLVPALKESKDSAKVVVAENTLPDSSAPIISSEHNLTSNEENTPTKDAPLENKELDNIDLLIPAEETPSIHIPAFKIARAKGNPDNTLIQTSDAYKAGEPENLLIPLEKDTSISAKEPAKVVSNPDKNKLAMLNEKASIRSMEKEAQPATTHAPNASTAKWQTMAEKGATNKNADVSKDDISVTSTKEKGILKKLDSQAELSETLNAPSPQTNASSVKLASETVDNLLIPIPEDILKDPNLTPQLVSSSQNKKLEEQITEEENKEYGIKEKDTPKAISSTQAQTGEKSGILQSITSIFSKTAENIKSTVENTGNDLLENFSKPKTSKTNISSGKILPTEIRLAFQPNRAEISGVTLKWLQAFANKTIEDKNAGLEIRIDGSSSYELQQKRLNLLNNILASNGVDFSKINTVFTTREPNSFVIRAIRLNNANGGMEENNDWQDYYKVW